MDSMVVDLPLSIMYSAANSLKRGYKIKLIDLRLVSGNWRWALKEYLDKGVLLAGISVMTGAPLKNARDIALFIKEHYPDTKIVWGGPHVTVIPETMAEPFLDFIVRGYGSLPLADLISFLKTGSPEISTIYGISYREKNFPIHNPRSSVHEMIDYRDIPYDLIDMNNPLYSRSYSNAKVFPMFTAIGCPYKCTFCIHPEVYKIINGKKWLPYTPEEVIEHMEYLISRYNAKFFCFIDDTSFPDLKRMEKIFNFIIEKKLNIDIEFRGARINELDRMSHSFLDFMEEAGGRVILVGVESASDRILKEMQKGITREQIFRVNKKLATHKRLRPMYNFIYGCPGETYQSLIETKDAILKLKEDNPNAYINLGGDWKPIPGTVMISIAEKQYGYVPPKTIDEWIEIDSSDAKEKIRFPWYTNRLNNLIKILQITSFVIGDKLVNESGNNKSFYFRLLRLGAKIYKPVANFRLKRNFPHFPIEYAIWKTLLRFMSPS